MYAHHAYFVYVMVVEIIKEKGTVYDDVSSELDNQSIN
jgi:hypothetical protein